MTKRTDIAKEEVAELVQNQLSAISDQHLLAAIRSLLVTPYPVKRSWDYGKPGETYVCWTVIEHQESNSGIAYCPEGFGPSYTWGLVFLTGPYMGIGMDSGWHVSLEHAFRNSMAWDGSNPEGYEIP